MPIKYFEFGEKKYIKYAFLFLLTLTIDFKLIWSKFLRNNCHQVTNPFNVTNVTEQFRTRSTEFGSGV